MIITDDFVVLNFPKTGSTFIRTVLKRIHRTRVRSMHPLQRLRCWAGLEQGPYFEEVILPRLMQHGTYRHIPASHRSKCVVSAVRNPYARFISEYRFRWWASHPEDFFSPEVVAAFPTFPDLSLEEYARIRTAQIAQDGIKAPIGPQTIAFIRMFFTDPGRVLGNMDEQYLDSNCFLEDMPEISFLRTEHLGQDLHAFLKEHRFSEAEIAFVPDHQRINVTQPSYEKKSTSWTPATLSFVHERERLLFRILDHRGFQYEQPAWQA